MQCDPQHLTSTVYGVEAVEFKTRMLIHGIELLYIVKGQWAPGEACVCLLAINCYAWLGMHRTMMDMHAPSPVCHRIFGGRSRKYKIVQLVLSDETMVNSTYHSHQTPDTKETAPGLNVTIHKISVFSNTDITSIE